MVSSRALSLITSLASLIAVSQAGYSILEEYNPSNFFSKFDFFTAPDPTHGFVKYVDQGTAWNTGLLAITDHSVRLGVDSRTVSSTGRASVRISSQRSYTRGLFIADIAHMPGSICGVWPAFWTVGPNWPNGGEIDIIEQVHEARNNHMTLHTNSGCWMSGGAQSGTQLGTDCNAWANGNAGCGVSNPSPHSYGSGFNEVGGGVYAMEWTSQHIAIWFWPRYAIPGDALSSNPNPASWGTPVAKFQGPCNIDANFHQHQIVFDTTFCGDWAGNTWGSSGCTAKAASCTDFVANNPGAFTEAFWEINSLKVFQG
ncbi:MAG: hypothetical protein M1833_004351 [Piccolia ochrophora]|nr:MAG: hypothetical protein M1833_004351 [Piccolia ochrophora]